jgi:acyl dehydratase
MRAISRSSMSRAGFDRPVLHGLASFGIVGHALLKNALSGDLAALSGLEGRFSAPLCPGETLRVEWWRGDDRLAFCAVVLQRQTVVMNNGSLWGPRR